MDFNALDDLLKLGSDDERKEKLKSLPQKGWSSLPLTRGFGPAAFQITEDYVFVKTLAVDLEDCESRVDILISRDTGKMMAFKEYQLWMGLSPERFVRRAEAELDIVFNHLPSHPSICPIHAWLRGSWIEGKEDPSRKFHYSLIMPLLRNDPWELNKENLKMWALSTVEVCIVLHERNIICSTLKHDCMLYDKFLNRFIMIDFGDLTIDNKAYPYDENGSGMTMAPEQKTGIYNDKVDAYALGILLAQMALGDGDLFKGRGTLPKKQRPVFWEKLKNRTPEEKRVFWEPYGLSGLTQYWTPELTDLIYQLTVHDPEKRLSCKDALNHPFFSVM